MSRPEKRVYFMKPVGMDGPIKVGCSVQPASRLKSVSLWSPFPLELICAVPGEHAEENDLHYLLREYQFNGEWFYPNRLLADIIAHAIEHGRLPEISVPERKGRDGAIPRHGFTEVSLAKSRLTGRISRAERHAHGWDRYDSRPAHITAIYDAYHDPLAPLPTGETMEELERYIASLLARPKADVSLAAWYKWRDRVDPTPRRARGLG